MKSVLLSAVRSLVVLKIALYVSRLHLHFKCHKKWRSFVKIILLNKKRKCHILENSYRLFVKGSQGDANLQLSLQKYIIPAALYNNNHYHAEMSGTVFT